MPSRRKTTSVRQSVTIPAKLVPEVRRVAKERQVSLSRALVTLAERGVEAEAEAKRQLRSSLDRFLSEKDPTKKDEAGRELIQSIFGKESIAEDPVL